MKFISEIQLIGHLLKFTIIILKNITEVCLRVSHFASCKLNLGVATYHVLITTCIDSMRSIYIRNYVYIDYVVYYIIYVIAYLLPSTFLKTFS